MSRYIDADEVKKQIYKAREKKCFFDDVINLGVDSTPTVDAVPKEKYDRLKEKYNRLLENATILSQACKEGENAIKRLS